ncbi:unnamed protein product [Rhizoctonia solani]|uniref:Uncharacterized protein n=1 Tax=Rhizoctonia solani TaxID=456999 RepID=A0A8H2XJ63_9AGAM|nr:unnamed protein product [Rhizoctonia solani]
MPPPKIPIDDPTEHSGDYSSLEAETFVRSCKLAVIATEVNKNKPSDGFGVAELQYVLSVSYLLAGHYHHSQAPT